VLKVKVKGHVIRALSLILGMSYSVIDGLVLFHPIYKNMTVINATRFVCMMLVISDKNSNAQQSDPKTHISFLFTRCRHSSDAATLQVLALLYGCPSSGGSTVAAAVYKNCDNLKLIIIN